MENSANNPKISSKDKAIYWADIFEQWQDSNLSQQDFCKVKALSFAQFGYWRKRLNEIEQSQSVKKLLPVNIVQPNGSAPISIKLPNGITLMIESYCSPALMQQTLKVLGCDLC